jgi:hypothetical protein
MNSGVDSRFADSMMSRQTMNTVSSPSPLSANFELPTGERQLSSHLRFQGINSSTSFSNCQIPDTFLGDYTRATSTNGTRKRKSMHQRSMLTPAEQEEDRQRLRNNNRLAAHKCREKKKMLEAQLEQKMARLCQENVYWQDRLAFTQGEVRRLHQLLSQHERCNHPDLQAYFAGQRGGMFYGQPTPPISHNGIPMGYGIGYVPQFFTNHSDYATNLQFLPTQLHDTNEFGHQTTPINPATRTPDSSIEMNGDANASTQTKDGGISAMTGMADKFKGK